MHNQHNVTNNHVSDQAKNIISTLQKKDTVTISDNDPEDNIKVIVEPEKGGKVSFPVYALEVLSDIGLGVIAGLTVNISADFIGKLFKLNRIGILIVQLFLITVVLYVIKIDSRYLYSTWRGETNYGIIFTAVFLAVQKNMVRFFEDIYNEEDNKIGIFGE